jgi:hypothetical protein
MRVCRQTRDDVAQLKESGEAIAARDVSVLRAMELELHALDASDDPNSERNVLKDWCAQFAPHGMQVC